ncbi:MAG: hypothetical protein KGL39_16610, partial [Patescibacteria group bacterium]|nr:hypothetical protein [Patescibacteria group bacterium]
MRSYLTVTEFQDHPTGVSVQNLIEGGNPGQEAAELAVLLQMCSSAIDTWCVQPQYARQVNVTQRLRPNGYGQLAVKTTDFPLISLASAQWKQNTSDSWNVITAANAMIDTEAHTWIDDSYPYMQCTGWGKPPILVQHSYVAGYPNAQTTVASVVGATQLTL